MKLATLKGKSQKGKNRIREHGEVWKILIEKDNSICVESLKNSNYGRWVDRTNDTDMEIISIVNP